MKIIQNHKNHSSDKRNTSPNPSKGGEQATNRGSGDSSCVSNSPSFGGGWGEASSCDSSPLSFGEGGGRGLSGLPRRSYLTARNDGVPFSSHVSRHCRRLLSGLVLSGVEVAEAYPQSPANLQRIPHCVRNDGVGVFAGDSCFRRNDGTAFCRDGACLLSAVEIRHVPTK